MEALLEKWNNFLNEGAADFYGSTYIEFKEKAEEVYIALKNQKPDPDEMSQTTLRVFLEKVDELAKEYFGKVLGTGRNRKVFQMDSGRIIKGRKFCSQASTRS